MEKAKSWIRELQRQADPSIIIALCGNKTDLAARRQVTQEEAQKYAEEEGLMWCEASAKTGEGVQDIFMAIGELILDLNSIHILISPYSQEATALCAPKSEGLCSCSWWSTRGRPQQADRRPRGLQLLDRMGMAQGLRRHLRVVQDRCYVSFGDDSFRIYGHASFYLHVPNDIRYDP